MGWSSQTRVNCVAARCQWSSRRPDQRSPDCCASRWGRIGRYADQSMTGLLATASAYEASGRSPVFAACRARIDS